MKKNIFSILLLATAVCFMVLGVLNGGMRDVFHDVCLTLDPTISDAEIYNLFDSSVSNPPAERRNHKLGTIVINYFPDEKRGLDTVRGHLELKAEYPVSRR